MTSVVRDITEVSEWNDFISKYGQWSFFQSFSWGEVQKKMGIPLTRIGLYSQDQLQAVAQILTVHAKRGTFISIRQGPVFSPEAVLNKSYWTDLIQYLREKAQSSGAWFIRMSPMIEDLEVHRELLGNFGCRNAPIHAMDGEYSWVLDVTKPEADLLQNMRKTTRYLIKQAEKMNVSVGKDLDLEDFLEMYKTTAARQGFIPHRGIKEEYEILKKEGKIILYTASHQGQLLAGALIVYFGKQAIYHHSGSIPSKIPAMYLLQWRAICDAKKAGMTTYNFWGIAPPEAKRHPWKGLTQFKQGFGGEAKAFLHAQDLSTSPLYTISYTIEMIRKLGKGY